MIFFSKERFLDFYGIMVLNWNLIMVFRNNSSISEEMYEFLQRNMLPLSVTERRQNIFKNINHFKTKDLSVQPMWDSGNFLTAFK